MTEAQKYIVENIRLAKGYDNKNIQSALLRRLRIPEAGLISWEITRRSIDARKGITFVLTVRITLSQKLTRKIPHTTPLVEQTPTSAIPFIGNKKGRPLVVGAGPAGLTAAWYLAKAGMQPLLIDRGDATENRHDKVQEFWDKGILDSESNVLFGEGGAGLFSDGKLTARTKERGHVRTFFELLVRHGASKEILIDTHPHIGTDLLRKIIPSICEEIRSLGGEIRYNTRLDDLLIADNAICGAVINGEKFDTTQVVLAIGHSARDTYRMIEKKQVALAPKAFAVGVRLELPQRNIDFSQYGRSYATLGAAAFRLTRKPEGNSRACYSFCMCPGGQVISCASEPGLLTSNGMSYSQRNAPCGNATFLVPVSVEDMCTDGIFTVDSALAFQESLEQKAFVAGGSDYALPAQTLAGFLSGKDIALPAYTSPHRVREASLRSILPSFVTDTLITALPPMLAQIHSPKFEDVVVYGTETRSSSPIQITRHRDTGESVSTKGLYPAGEGAGYAGGIVSSGIDGIKAAEHICAE